MERFVFFCFRSCLKGEKDTEYYDVLELDPHSKVTPEIAKKQYKKLSLALHPDKLAQRGVEVTPELKHKFLKLKEAHDCLADAGRKRLYDEYGESGLKLLESPTEVNHMELLRNFQKNHGDRTTLGLFILFVFLCLFLLPVLFCLKSDGTLGDSAPWVAIWSPAWLVDIVLLVSAVTILTATEKPETNEDDDEVPAVKVPLFDKLVHVASTIAFVLVQILVTMRIDKYTKWSWFAVFVPWYVYEVLSAMSQAQLAFFTTVSPPSGDSTNIDVEEGHEEDAFMQRINEETAYFQKIMEIGSAQRGILAAALRVWQALFLAAQLDGSVDWNWGLVALPAWVYLFVQYLYVYLYRAWGASKLQGLNPEDIMSGRETDPTVLMRFQQGQELSTYSTLICFSQLVVVFMTVMLVCRLQDANYSTFLIILPVFIALGCLCCVVFCGLCCLSTLDMDSMEEEMQKAQGGGAAADPEQGAYEPPAASPIVPTPPEEYGTFAAGSDPIAGSASQSPLVDVSTPLSEAAHTPGPAPSVLAVSTTIDVDID